MATAFDDPLAVIQYAIRLYKTFYVLRLPDGSFVASEFGAPGFSKGERVAYIALYPGAREHFKSAMEGLDENG